MFDADAFMNANVDAPMATSMQATPEGEYQATIDNFDSSALRTVKTKNGDKQILTIPFVINDVALQEKLKRTAPVVHREDFWLDFDDNGQLGTGADQNVRLGQLRAAVGQNAGAWSPAMLRGAGPLMIAIKHRSDPNDPEKKYAGISKYSKIS